MLAKVAGSNQFKVGQGDKTWNELEYVASIAFGSGLALDADGKIIVDFSQMPTEKFEALLKSIRVLVEAKSNMSFYVDGATGSDVLSSGRGLSTNAPFKTIQACVNYVVNTYQLNSYYATIYIAPGSYNEMLILPAYSGNTPIYLQNQDPSQQVKIAKTNLNPWESLVTIKSTWYFQDIDFEVLQVEPNIPSTLNAYISCINASYGNQIRFYGCTFKMISTGENTKDFRYNILFYTYANCSIRIYPSSRNATKSIMFEMTSEHTEKLNFIFFNILENSTLQLTHQNIDKAPRIVQINGKCSTFADVNSGSFYVSSLTTFSTDNAFTGKRFTLSNRGLISVNGRGEEFLPGSTAGTIANNQFCIYM